MTPFAIIFGLLPLAIWLVLILGRGFFWLARERDDREPDPAPPDHWPDVAVVVPARDEADVIDKSIESLVNQLYPGRFTVILVDDNSSDNTAALARRAADAIASDRLTVLPGRPLPIGWTGKLWAVSQGVDHVLRSDPPPRWLLLTDADIAHSPHALDQLVARAEQGDLVLVSLMAKLHCRTWPERFLIPAFVFFFQMLYPFSRVNDPHSRVAAAAGGCMLIRADALEAMGGIAAIRHAIIDDCTLGKALKQQGPIWLGLTHRVRSLRPYRGFGEIGRMISRSAYAQLQYSPWLLLGTLIGMTLTFVAPPLAVLFGNGVTQIAGLAAWLLMALSLSPMLRFYHRFPLWGLALPLIAIFYAGCTFHSALQFWLGRGGMWKGRAQAMTGV